MLHSCPPFWPAIASALAGAQPGDVIEIVGDYAQPSTGEVSPVSATGTADAPIVLRMAHGCRMIGRAYASREKWRAPKSTKKPEQGAPFIKLAGSEHVRFEGLTIVDAWPTAIDLVDCRSIAFTGCHAEGGRHVFRVRDRINAAGGIDTQSSGIKVIGCCWEQDARIWQEISWDEIHDGAYKYLNGALLRTDNVAGNVIFADNHIRDAYNGLKCTAPATLPVGVRRNESFDIRGNVFERVRDNPIEPEGYAYDWHIHHNELIDCHGWFSLDGVRGGYWFIYANRAWFRSRQGSPGADDRPDTHRRGFAFKMAYLPPEQMPDPVYVFNNSFHLRVPIFGNAQDVPPYSYSVKNWYFHDNAFEWRAEVAWAESGAKPDDEPVLGAIEPGIVFEQPFAFAGSLSNSISGWHGFVDRVGVGQSASNHYHQGRVFKDGAQGDFALCRGSAGRRSAAAFDIWLASRSTPWPLLRGRNIGAVQPADVNPRWPPFEPA